jgi:hypothetical protein
MTNQTSDMSNVKILLFSPFFIFLLCQNICQDEVFDVIKVLSDVLILILKSNKVVRDEFALTSKQKKCISHLQFAFYAYYFSVKRSVEE